MDIYTAVPIAETPHFRLRLIVPEDAPALFACYHDQAAVALMNADNCDFGFYMDTPEQMAETVAYWLRHYAWRSFVRFAIVEKESGQAVGTIEGFGGGTGVLRLDIAAAFEQADLIAELLGFAAARFHEYFGNDELVIKAIPAAAERRQALESAGWTYIGPFRSYEHYYRIPLA